MPDSSGTSSSPRGRPLLWRVGAACAGLLASFVLLAVLALAFPKCFLLVEGAEREADLIIVLGGETPARAELCAALHRRGAARHIIVSGAGDGPVIAHELRGAGVPAGAILMERDSVSTFENARLTAPLLETMHVRRAFVVTSWFHTRRALACFQRASPQVQFIAVAAPFEWPTARDRWRGLAREYSKLLGYWIAHGCRRGRVLRRRSEVESLVCPTLDPRRGLSRVNQKDTIKKTIRIRALPNLFSTGMKHDSLRAMSATIPRLRKFTARLSGVLLLVAAPAGAVAGGLTWDATLKDFHPPAGATNLVFSYAFTNASPEELVILALRPSCGCTAMQTPPLPWRIPAGSNGVVAATIDLRAKWGILTKSITVDTSGGTTHLLARLHLPAAPAASTDPGVPGLPAPLDERVRNQLLAQSNRQVVFRGDCARCHAEPAKGKLGAELYSAACANCHDSPNRATMVPDLRALNKPTPEMFWQLWIRFGREQSLMPAFDINHGGPLNEEQIVSLSKWLATEFRSVPAGAPAAK